MKSILLPALLALALSACATTADLPRNYTLEATQQEGLAIVSLTLSGKALDRYSSFEFQVREVSAKTADPIVTKRHFDSPTQHARWAARGKEDGAADWRTIIKGPNSSEPLDINTGGVPVGRVVSLRLPAGEYEFYAWTLREADAYGSVESSPARAFSYRFTVSPGGATYIGQLNLQVSEQGSAITVEDRRERDIALLGQKAPTIVAAPIHSDIRRIQP